MLTLRLPDNSGVIIDHQTKRIGIMMDPCGVRVGWVSGDNDNYDENNTGAATYNLENHLFIADIAGHIHGCFDRTPRETRYGIFLLDEEKGIAASSAGNSYENGDMCWGDIDVDSNPRRMYQKYFSSGFNSDLVHSMSHVPIEEILRDNPDTARMWNSAVEGLEEMRERIGPVSREVDLGDINARFGLQHERVSKILESLHFQWSRASSILQERHLGRGCSWYPTRDGYPRAYKRFMLSRGLRWNTDSKSFENESGLRTSCGHPSSSTSHEESGVKKRDEALRRSVCRVKARVQRYSAYSDYCHNLSNTWTYLESIAVSYISRLCSSLQYDERATLPGRLDVEVMRGPPGYLNRSSDRLAKSECRRVMSAYFSAVRELLHQDDYIERRLRTRAIGEGFRANDIVGRMCGMEEDLHLTYPKWRPMSYRFSSGMQIEDEFPATHIILVVKDQVGGESLKYSDLADLLELEGLLIETDAGDDVGECCLCRSRIRGDNHLHRCEARRMGDLESEYSVGVACIMPDGTELAKFGDSVFLGNEDDNGRWGWKPYEEVS